MEKNNKPLVAVDFGGGSIKVMAAERIAPNTLKILGAETNEKYACINKGVIINTGNAGYMLKESLKLLANRIGVKDINTVFALLGGGSMQLIELKSPHDFVRKKELTPAVLEDLKNTCRKNHEAKNPSIAILDLIPSYYIADGKETDDIPEKGMKASVIEPHYVAFVGEKQLKSKVEDSFDHAFVHMEHTFVRPDAHFSALTADEPELLTNGCAIIDLGAQTTTLSIYKGNQYLACKVIGAGGRDITKAIAREGGIDMQHAELIKCRYGYALPELIEKDKMLRILTNNSESRELKIKMSELSEIIKTELDTIMQPLFEVLGKYEGRIETVLITGGGSRMEGIAEYVQTNTDIDVDYGNHASLLAPDTDDEWYSPEYSALIGALIMGSDYRDTHEPITETKEESLLDKARKGLKKIGDQTSIFFTDNE